MRNKTAANVFLTAKRPDETFDDEPRTSGNVTEFVPYLICVWKRDKLPKYDGGTFHYSFCDYLIYYPSTEEFDS
ncbi:hypothetical protein MTO96_018779, partial [Rhipicephalus appendiculatus]